MGLISSAVASHNGPPAPGPGAGMDIDSIVPFQTVTKDGYLMIDCVKDLLFENGDKHGDGKLRYKMQTMNSNVSIVRYETLVAKEDRQAMTHVKCFEFCRTVPDMSFFGLKDGRYCYCMPYYQHVSGDSSNCDVPCEGAPELMCGGRKKSTIFEMHSCNDAVEKVIEMRDKVETAGDRLEHRANLLKTLCETAEGHMDDLKKIFGEAGDPDSSQLFQDAKVFIGKYEKIYEAALDHYSHMTEIYDELNVLRNQNLQDSDNLIAAERAQERGTASIAKAKEAREELEKMHAAVKPWFDSPHHFFEESPGPTANEPENAVQNATIQYYPIMYYAGQTPADNKWMNNSASFLHPPETCTGEISQILFHATAVDCAVACDDAQEKCMAFQYYAYEHGYCFLFSKVKAVTNWVGCHGDEHGPEPFSAQCYAKLQYYNGVNIEVKTDGTATEMSLKEVTEANRCYVAGPGCWDVDNFFRHNWQWLGGEQGWVNNKIHISCDRFENNPAECNWFSAWARMDAGKGDGNADGFTTQNSWIAANEVCSECGTCSGKKSWSDFTAYIYHYYYSYY